MSTRTLSLGLLAVAAIAGFAADSDAATGLAVLAVATAAAVFATPPRGRPAVGAVVVAVGVVVVVAETSGDTTDWLLALSVVSLVGAGMLIAFWGRRWPALARRYGGAGGPVQAPEDLWRALDRGVDPTDDAPRPSEPGPGRPVVD